MRPIYRGKRERRSTRSPARPRDKSRRTSEPREALDHNRESGLPTVARILFIDQYASLGGGQRILLDVVQAFAEAGHTCHVALPGSGEVTAALDRLGIEHLPLTVPPSL